MTIHLCLNRAVRADVEAVEDDVEVPGGGGHQQQQEVEVGVGEQAVVVDGVEQVAAFHRQLVHVHHVVGVELRVGDLLVGGLAEHHLVGETAPWGHRVVEVARAHQSCLPSC